MSLLWVDALWLLLLVPVLVYIYILIQRRRHKYSLKFSSISLMKQALANRPGIKRHVPPMLFLLAVITLIVALARPHATTILPSQQATVILAIDVSRSMRADDIKPTRLEAAKAAALSFVENQPQNVRIGIVSFSGGASLVQAPTTKHEEIRAAINRLSIQSRTAIGDGILTSLYAIFEKPDQKPADSSSSDILVPFTRTPEPPPMQQTGHVPAVIILLSDGRNTTGPHPLDVIDQAISRGISVYTVGIGSAQGTIVNRGEYSVFMRFDEETLKRIAERTNARYFTADNEADLLAIYQTLGTELVIRTEETELTAIFTGFAVILVLISVIFSMLWFNRLP